MSEGINLSELAISKEYVFDNVECRLLMDCKIISKTGGLICTGEDNFQLRTPKFYYDLTITDNQIRMEIAKKIQQGFVLLANVTADMTKSRDDALKKIIILEIFAIRLGRKMGTLEILISEKVKDVLIKKGFYDADNFNTAMENLFDEQFAVTEGVSEKNGFLYVNSSFEEIAKEQSFDDAESNEISESKNADNVQVKPEDEEEIASVNKKAKGFRLLGQDFDFIVTVTDEDKLLVKRVVFKTNQQMLPSIAKGKIIFSDFAGVVDKSILNSMSASHAYVETWNKYSNMEGEFLFKRLRLIGNIRILPNQTFTRNSEGKLEVIIDPLSRAALDFLTEGDSLEVVEKLPEYLVDLNMTWPEYCENQEKIRLAKKRRHMHDDNYDGDYGDDHSDVGDVGDIYEDAEGNNDRSGELIKILKVNKSHGVLTLDCVQLPAGKLICSMRGDEARLKRRQIARDNIMNGNVPNPRIAEIISRNLLMSELDNYSVTKGQLYTRNKPLSASIKRKIFPKNPPTAVQKEAIDIAINTPDIAIIQGPPGTGKTTVITAILERLNELSNKNSVKQGRVLITSLQHDAVENVIERIKINSLPTIKFGKRSGNNIQYDDLNSAVLMWCDDIAGKLKTKNPALQISQEHERLNDYYHLYVSNPTDENAAAFLNLAKNTIFDKECLAEIEEILHDIEVVDSNSSDLLPDIRRIRVSKNGFLDDGALNAKKAYLKLMDVLPAEDWRLRALREATLAGDNPSQELLQNLRNAKNDLILSCIPKPVYKIPVLRDDIVELYNKINKLLYKPTDKKEIILHELLEELENNPDGISNVVANYSYAFAATAQQCEGKDIRAAKGIEWFQKDCHPEYDTVIVDEAARVTPLDLMIPLSQAKERIILVGDHRQLPHMYDEAIFEAMREQGEEINEPDITVSMFQNLKDKALLLEKIDGVKRFITLDAQYRTHPLLGKFLSEQFYQPYGEEFKSPLSEDLFGQNLYDVPLVWLDIPYAAGNEKSYNGSRCRAIEADIIVERICSYLEKDEENCRKIIDELERKLCDAGATAREIDIEIRCKENELRKRMLTYGVITFYSAQVNVIRTAFEKKLGKTKVKELFEKQRLRVGSVDAFQGMEFDVIFLSVVRTNKMPVISEFKEGKRIKRPYQAFDDREFLESIKDNEKKLDMSVGIANYGFLTSKNRLCVAMSRQKKLLIVVGDSNIFVGDAFSDIAEYCVPAMKHLYGLCEVEGIIEHEK